MAAIPTSSYPNTMMAQPPRTVHSLVNEESRAPPPVRLYPSQHRVSMTRYATSTDPRGYIPVFEYPLNGQYIMIDCETGMVHFTGIWKALGHTKADVVKLVESDPTIAPYLRKVRGGYLKIQGTWLPFETAQTLARRVAWQVRYDLIPLFGPDFPDTCLGPGEPGFGQLLLSAPKPRGRRGAKKSAPASATEKAAAPPISGKSGRHNGQNPYAPGEPGRPRSTGRAEVAGSFSSHTSSVSQSRYSPYARPPSHGITQLEPLPNLLQPDQGRPTQQNEALYGSNYRQPERSSSMAVNSGSFPLINNYLMGSSDVAASSVGSTPAAPLPPMRNNSSSNNFFETYRGPDSFEALSNRWLASDASEANNVPDQALLNGDSGDGLRRMQYSNYMMLPKEPPQAMNDYNFPQPIESAPGGPHRPGSLPSTESRGPAYSFDQKYESSFRQGVSSETWDRRSSSSPGYQISNAGGYDGALAGNSSVNQANDCPPRANQGSYNDSQTSTSGNVTCSPNSHSIKSPSPSAASTSTHLPHSYHRPSHSSSHHTIPSFGSHKGSNFRPEDMAQFSVLTSPAHLELEASRGSMQSTIQHSDSDWNSARNSSGMSPSSVINS